MMFGGLNQSFAVEQGRQREGEWGWRLDGRLTRSEMRQAGRDPQADNEDEAQVNKTKQDAGY